MNYIDTKELKKTKDEKTGKETEKGAKLSDVSKINVNATDNSTRRTGAGELTWSNNGIAAVGAAIAYSELNHVSNHTALQRDIWSIARVTNCSRWWRRRADWGR